LYNLLIVCIVQISYISCYVPETEVKINAIKDELAQKKKEETTMKESWEALWDEHTKELQVS